MRPRPRSESYRDSDTRVFIAWALNHWAVSDNVTYNGAVKDGIREMEGSKTGVVHMEKNELNIRPQGSSH